MATGGGRLLLTDASFFHLFSRLLLCAGFLFNLLLMSMGEMVQKGGRGTSEELIRYIKMEKSSLDGVYFR
jgi:hypothetical protein